MQFVNATPPYGVERHVCDSYRDGEWIVHRCTQCNYEFRDNWRTGEIKVRNANIAINHSGSYFPEEFGQLYDNRN